MLEVREQIKQTEISKKKDVFLANYLIKTKIVDNVKEKENCQGKLNFLRKVVKFIFCDSE